MAHRNLSIRFGTDGYQEVMSSLRQVGKAFDDSLQKAQESIEQASKAAREAVDKGDLAAFNQAEEEKAQAAKQATRAIKQAYRELRVSSSEDIEAKKSSAISAYEAIKNSGTASASDIARAQEALKEKLQELDESAKGAEGGFTILKGVIANLISSATIAGVQALAGAFDSMRSSITNAVDAAAEIDRTMRSLDALIQGTGRSANLTAQEIDEFAIALGESTLTSREAVLEASRAMLSFRSISEPVMFRAIELSQDLAEVMGQDIRSASRQMALALEDPVRGLQALRRSGTTFTEEQRNLIRSLVESNQQLEAQTVILDVIESQYGGAAQAAAGGYAGALDTIGERWRRLQQILGDALTPAFQAAADVILVVQENLLDLGGGIMDDINRQAQEFAEYLKANPQFIESLTRSIRLGLTRAFEAISRLARGILDYLQQNPRAIEDAIRAVESMVKVAMELLRVVNLVVEGWQKIAALSADVGPNAARNAFSNQAGALGPEAQAEFNRRFQERSERELRGVRLSEGRREMASRIAEEVYAEVFREFAGRQGEQPGAQRPHLGPGRPQLGPPLPPPRPGASAPPIPVEVEVSSASAPLVSGAEPAANFPITSGFGMRVHPITGESRLHAGIDLGTPVGTPISTNLGGEVLRAGTFGNYGKGIEVLLEDGMQFFFAHLDQILVSAGERFIAGQLLGKTGNTGLTTGPHLHLEAGGQGAEFDPTPFLSYINLGGQVAGGSAQLTPLARSQQAFAQQQARAAEEAAREAERQRQEEERRRREERDRIARIERERQALFFDEELSKFDLATAQMEPGFARDQRGIERDKLERSFALQRELLQIEQQIKALAEDTPDGYQLQIDLLEERKRVLRETADVAQQIVDLEAIERLEQQSQRTTERLFETNQELARFEATLADDSAESRQEAALNQVVDSFAQYKESIAAAMAELVKLIEAKEYYGLVTDEEQSQLDTLRGRYERLLDLQGQRIDKTRQEIAAQEDLNRARQREELAQVGARADFIRADLLQGIGRDDAANRLRREATIAEAVARQGAEIAALNAQRATATDGETIAYLDALIAKTKELNELELTQIEMQFSTLQETLQAVSEAFGQALGQLFDDLLRGTQSFGDSLLSFLSNLFQQVGQIFLQMATQELSRALFSGLSGLFGGFGGIGFATGGPVRGPGSSTSDSIAARLSNGEFVMNAASVRFWGEDFMNAINLRQPLGLSAMTAVGAGAGGNTIVNVNVSTPNADSFRRSRNQIESEQAQAIARASNRR